MRPSWLQPGTTKVAVIGTNHPYFQNKVETKMELWIEGHVQALKTVQQIMSYSIQGANYFDFLACFMPATALLPQILPVFMQTISSILGKRYSIHIHKTQLPQYGLFLDKAFVVILASPICAEPRWDWNIPTPYGTSLGDVIGDLSFQNPRKEHSKGPYALACKNTSSNKDSTVYNHNTGHTQVSGATQPVVLDTPEALRLPLFRAPLYLHPGKFLNLKNIVYIYIRLTFIVIIKSATIYSLSERWPEFLGFPMILSSMMGLEAHIITSAKLCHHQ